MAHENDQVSQIALTSEEQESLAHLLQHEDIVKLIKEVKKRNEK